MSGSTERPVRRRADKPHQTPAPGSPPAEKPGAQPAPAGSFRDRGRLRRRLRYLRRARELGYRDLGGFMFDLHRFGRKSDDLVHSKLAALAAIDKELRALETALGERREVAVLREPGIGSCVRCGALHGSADSFCPHCGQQFGRSAPAQASASAEGGSEASDAQTAEDRSEASDAPTTQTGGASGS
jgi:hypothetical protein